MGAYWSTGGLLERVLVDRTPLYSTKPGDPPPKIHNSGNLVSISPQSLVNSTYNEQSIPSTIYSESRWHWSISGIVNINMLTHLIYCVLMCVLINDGVEYEKANISRGYIGAWSQGVAFECASDWCSVHW